MKYIGIVGSEGKKFSEYSEAAARSLIFDLMDGDNITVVSGECHLGGVDLFAKEEALRVGIPFIGYPPKTLAWSTGYKPRNIQIAERSDVVYCVTVDRLPETYEGMTFPLCYHCGTKDHVKSGGCWTVKYAKKIGKDGLVYTIHQR